MPSSPLSKRTQSKTREESTDLTFPEAIQAVIDGKIISKREWDNPGVYGTLKDYKLRWVDSSGKWHDWIINDGDLNGTDWFVIDIES